MTNESSSTSLDLLISGVLAIIREYDRSGDHLPHGPGSDCVRCSLLAAAASRTTAPRARSFQQSRADHAMAQDDIERSHAAVLAADKVVSARTVSIPDHVVAVLRERASGFVVRVERKPDDDDITRRDQIARALIDAWSEGALYLGSAR